MTKVPRWFKIGAHALVAVSLGAGAMHLLDHEWQRGGSDSAASPAFPDRTGRPAGSGESEAVTLLGRLARDPYAKLSDAEIAGIAASLDMTKESSWRLLNAVASSALCQRLWDACIRANVGKMDLQDLMAIAKHGESRCELLVYGGIFDAIRERGSEDKELSTPRGRKLMASCLYYMVNKVGSFDELMTLVPKQMGASYRESALFAWASEPTAQRVREILALPLEEGGGAALHVAAWSWERLKSDERAALMQDLDQLPEARRNRFLAEILMQNGAADMTATSDLLTRITSYAQQEAVVAGMIRDPFMPGPGIAPGLVAALKEGIANSEHAAELQRISAFLERQKLMTEAGDGEAGDDGGGEGGK